MVLGPQVVVGFPLPEGGCVAEAAEEEVTPVPVLAEVVAEPRVEPGGAVVVVPEVEPVVVDVPEHVVVSFLCFFLRSSALIYIVVNGLDDDSSWKEVETFRRALQLYIRQQLSGDENIVIW